MTLDTFTSSKTTAMKRFYQYARANNLSNNNLWDWVDAFNEWQAGKK